jgi:hypothetical protein
MLLIYFEFMHYSLYATVFFHLPWRQTVTYFPDSTLHAQDHTKTAKYSNLRTCFLFLSCLKNLRRKKLHHRIHKRQPLDSISKSSTELIRLKPILLSSSLQLCLPNALRVLGVKDTSKGEQSLLSAVEYLIE